MVNHHNDIPVEGLQFPCLSVTRVRITRSSTKCTTCSWVIVPKVPWNTKKASTKNLKYFITTLAWRWSCWRMPWRSRCHKQLVWFNQRYSTDSSNITPHTTVGSSYSHHPNVTIFPGNVSMMRPNGHCLGFSLSATKSTKFPTKIRCCSLPLCHTLKR